ncbi:MAG: SUMF1/EgtB/PvdO family nonheme iron enzyme [Phycisphaerae bacterium]|nr:SUMF1/EgtB/PvdO family nonheme iron enzyme [Phycisphaerae bacterium]
MQRFIVRSRVLAVVLILGATIETGIHIAEAAPLSSSDFDGDGDVDLTDFGGFQACFNGPNRSPTIFCAVDADLDNDNDVDLTDFAVFAACFNGPNRMPACPADLLPGMVLIPGGEFLMGNSFTGEGEPRELPRHAVCVDAFYMDVTEVTNQQYADALNWALAQGNQITVTDGVVYKFNSGTSYPYISTTSAPPGDPNYGEYARITWNAGTFDVVSTSKKNHPVVAVSWYGAVAYANWRSGMEGRPLGYDLSTWECDFDASGYRLPTEAEWERAARGGVAGHRFPWADSDYIQHARANYFSSATYWYDTSPTRDHHPLWGVGNPPYTSPVGFFTGELRQKVHFDWPGTETSYQTLNDANDYGLRDMGGNVWEWCNDWYSETYYQWCEDNCETPCRNPRGPEAPQSQRVVRGGGWNDGTDWSRPAARYYDPPQQRHHNMHGLRVVLGFP